MRSARGFTLIELMVVVTIIALLVGGAVLSLGLGRTDSDSRRLEARAQSVQALLDFMRDLALIEARPYGMHVTPAGFSLQAFDTRRRTWVEASDPALRPQRWEEGLLANVIVDGRRIVLDERAGPPQFGVDAEGEFTAFALELSQPGAGVWQVRPDVRGEIEIQRIDSSSRP